MGEPRKFRKKYIKPKILWDTERINEDRKLVQRYGLKNKKEIWKAESLVKRIRSQAKRLLTAQQEAQKEFLQKLARQGFIKANAVDEVLGIRIENILDRRLQTILINKFGLRPRQARQAIVHGHVKINERKVNVPSYFVDVNTENKIFYTKQNLKLIKN